MNEEIKKKYRTLYNILIHVCAKNNEHGCKTEAVIRSDLFVTLISIYSHQSAPRGQRTCAPYYRSDEHQRANRHNNIAADFTNNNVKLNIILTYYQLNVQKIILSEVKLKERSKQK